MTAHGSHEYSHHRVESSRKQPQTSLIDNHLSNAHYQLLIPTALLTLPGASFYYLPNICNCAHQVAAKDKTQEQSRKKENESFPSEQSEGRILNTQFQPVYPDLEDVTQSQPVYPDLEDVIQSQPVYPDLEDVIQSQPVYPDLEDVIQSQPVQPGFGRKINFYPTD
ncbi:hypothetical protein CAEBREN_29288 [Caenorhabditis brenneri]|uniref:Uncharacterized protein n=1 Tax=Caenorhabditis brenneri TaxID=135651 RepID=G0P7I0_CAEBE|nr:hypothetical protein CAEBREN_29288 [Caenorhabditis brenneri]